MAQYTFRDIEEFCWMMISSNGQDMVFLIMGLILNSIRFSIPVVKKDRVGYCGDSNMKVVEDSKPVSEEYKMQSFARMMDRLQHESSQPVQLHKKHYLIGE